MPVYDQTQSLGHLTGLSGRLFNTLLTRRFSAAGIEMTAEQWGVILLLLNHGAVTQGQLAEMLYLEKSTVSRSVTSLEKRGWVVREKVLTPDLRDHPDRFDVSRPPSSP